MNALKWAKLGVQVVTLVAGLAMSVIADKQQSAKIAAEVAKQLADKQ